MDAEKWFREAVERHRDMVFRLAYTYLRDPADADDVTQDVFVKLLRSGKRFEGDDHLRYWLVRVTINECKSLFRKPYGVASRYRGVRGRRCELQTSSIVICWFA